MRWYFFCGFEEWLGRSGVSLRFTLCSENGLRHHFFKNIGQVRDVRYILTRI